MNTQTTKPTRDLSIDFMKGILIFLVVWGHCISKFDGNFEENRIGAMIYSFHMPLFIMISGMFSLNTLSKGLRQTFARRTTRLLIQALIWSGVFLLIRVIETHSISPKMIVDSIRGAWFLYCLYFLYLGAAAIWSLKHRYLVAALIGLALYVLFPYWPAGLKHFVWYLQLTKQWPMFILGALIAERHYLKNWGGQVFHVVLAISISVYALFIYERIILMKESWSLGSDTYIWSGVLSLCSSFVWFVVLQKTYNYLPLKQVFVSIGNATLGIYMVHGALLHVMPGFGISDVEMFLMAIAVTAVSYLLTILLRRTTLTKKYLLGEQ